MLLTTCTFILAKAAVRRRRLLQSKVCNHETHRSFCDRAAAAAALAQVKREPTAPILI